MGTKILDHDVFWEEAEACFHQCFRGRMSERVGTLVLRACEAT